MASFYLFHVKREGLAPTAPICDLDEVSMRRALSAIRYAV